MTPCEKLGYKVGDEFEVVSSNHFNLNKGDIVTLHEDDGTNTPYFYYNGETRYVVSLNKIKPLRITLRKGDYVATADIKDEAEYHAIARAFMAAGCHEGAYKFQAWNCLAFGWWDRRDALLFASCHDFNRQLTPAQVLSATNAGNNSEESDMGKWVPEVGKPAQTSGGECEVLAIDEERSQASIRWKNGELTVVRVECLKPLPSEEDIAVDDIFQIIFATDDYRDAAKALYRAGYRKQPAVDMQDPANWRAGDWVECVDEGSTRNTKGLFTNGKRYKLIVNDGSDSFAYRANDGERHYADNICFRFVRHP